MSVHPLAGKPAPAELLVNIPRLVSAYYTGKPDVSEAGQRVSFGTSGHRGSSFKNSFNEDHIVAITQAICEYRQAQGTTGPLYLGMDTHALSEPALVEHRLHPASIAFWLGGQIRRLGPQAEIKYRYLLKGLTDQGYSAIGLGELRR